MKKKKLILPYLTRLVKKLAPKVGAKVVVEPEWGVAFQVVYKNGVVRSFFNHFLDLNSVASSEISNDKGHAKFFMRANGYSVAEGTTVFSDAWADTLKSDNKIPAALKYAEKLGYPLVIKPNSKSQGKDVYVVFNKNELVSGLKDIFMNDRVAIVERYLPGRDYRIVVLDGEVLYAYERTPLSVVGDGKKSILALLKQNEVSLHGKDVEINSTDKRIQLKLKHMGYSLETVLQKGERVCLLYNANLSSGGEASDVSSSINSGFKKIATKLTKDMGLVMCGVDIMLTKGDISQDPKYCSYYIIETNSAIGLEPLESTYLKILKALGKKD